MQIALDITIYEDLLERYKFDNVYVIGVKFGTWITFENLYNRQAENLISNKLKLESCNLATAQPFGMYFNDEAGFFFEKSENIQISLCYLAPGNPMKVFGSVWAIGGYGDKPMKNIRKKSTAAPGNRIE